MKRIKQAIKFTLVLLLLPVSGVGCANPNNVMLGEYQSQISTYGGRSDGQGGLKHLAGAAWEDEDFWMVQLQYSQPDTFFRVPSRRNVELMQWFGFGMTDNGTDSMSSYDQQLIGLSLDMQLITIGRFYYGLGGGVYVGQRMTARNGSRMTFGAKMFMGYRWGKFAIELNTRHFSNGDVEQPNHGQNFEGFTLLYTY
ncbi:hypothetical protein RsTz2092_07880 [Deferribacterales bacterium RsTz2092]|nr:hypothetical protein AGMMS49941_05170 [Deferribacterales bacterium]